MTHSTRCCAWQAEQEAAVINRLKAFRSELHTDPNTEGQVHGAVGSAARSAARCAARCAAEMIPRDKQVSVLHNMNGSRINV